MTSSRSSMPASRPPKAVRHQPPIAVATIALGAVLATFVGLSGHATEQLAPTAHPPLPATASDMWLVPSETAATTRAATANRPLTDAVAEIAADNFDSALTLLGRPSLSGSALADYASYYKGIALLRMNRAAEARDAFDALQKRKPTGYLSIATSLGEAEAAVALGDHAKAMGIYEKLTAERTVVNESILAKQAETARVLGERRKTAEALLRIYYEFPLTDAAIAAAAELEPLRDIVVRQGYKLDLGPSHPAVRRAPVFRRARRLCRASERSQRRRSRARRSPHRRVRLLPAASCGGARWRPAVDRTRDRARPKPDSFK